MYQSIIPTIRDAFRIADARVAIIEEGRHGDKSSIKVECFTSSPIPNYTKGKEVFGKVLKFLLQHGVSANVYSVEVQKGSSSAMETWAIKPSKGHRYFMVVLTDIIIAPSPVCEA